MVHVALKLRSDVLSHSEHKEFAVSEENMISSVPESLFMFLRLILDGQSLLEEDLEEDDPDCDDQSQTEARTQKRILSLAKTLCTVSLVANVGHQSTLDLAVHCTRQLGPKNL